MIVKNKKKILANIVFNKFTRILEPALLKLRKENLTVLGYHRIYPEPYGKYLFDIDIVSASPEMFDKQLRLIKKMDFKVINFYQLNEIYLRNKKIPSNTLIITFDDGYADNYAIASNILFSHGMTAVFFISTGYIGSSEGFWFEKLTYQIQRMNDKTLQINDGKISIHVHENNRREVIKQLIDIIKNNSEEYRIKILYEIDQQCEYNPDNYEQVKTLSWDQVKEMSQRGFEIGSHSVSHPFLTRVDDEKLTQELKKSKNQIEKICGKKVITIGYPFGDYDNNVIQKAINCGYLFGCSYKHDISKFREDIRFEIPRIHMEKDVNENLFKGFLISPQVFIKYGE
jgi:peptidoglycan/xylan/chitin deacetylase (PgdA/CDA1 family)